MQSYRFAYSDAKIRQKTSGENVVQSEGRSIGFAEVLGTLNYSRDYVRDYVRKTDNRVVFTLIRLGVCVETPVLLLVDGIMSSRVPRIVTLFNSTRGNTTPRFARPQDDWRRAPTNRIPETVPSRARVSQYVLLIGWK